MFKMVFAVIAFIFSFALVFIYSKRAFEERNIPTVVRIVAALVIAGLLTSLVLL